MPAEALKNLVEISTAVYEARSREDLLDVIQFGCTSLGFDRFNLSCHAPTTRDLTLNPTISSFSDEYRQEYQALELDSGDVHVDRAMATGGAFSWSSHAEVAADMGQRQYLDCLDRHAMRAGIVVPLGRRGSTVSLFTVVRAADLPLELKHLQAATILADFAKAKAEMLGLCPEISLEEAIALRSLSSVQRTILDWIAEGKSNADIATIMSLPERTVRYHVSEILRKLHVATRMQAASVGLAARPVTRL